MAKMLTIRFVRNCPTIGKKQGDTMTMHEDTYKAYQAEGKNASTKKPLSPYVNHTEIIDEVEIKEPEKEPEEK